MKIVIGSRESALAVAQTKILLEYIEENCPGISAKMLTMKTTGDRILEKRLEENTEKAPETSAEIPPLPYHTVPNRIFTRQLSPCGKRSRRRKEPGAPGGMRCNMRTAQRRRPW